MNPRIKELIEEATMITEVWNDEVGTKRYLQLNEEKFAELIVRECINKITTYDLVPGHSAKWEDIYDIHVRLLQDLAEDLKEHFGIEE